MLVLTAAVTAALVIGFLGGLLTFKRAARWCVVCGHLLCCPHGHRQRPRTPGPTPAGPDRRTAAFRVNRRG